MSQQSVRISLNNLGFDRLEPYLQTLTSILSTTLAEQTFSQIIDHLPISSVFYKYGSGWRPDITAHVNICQESVEAWKTFREQFVPASLEIDAKLVQRYQDSKAGSNESELLLLEIIAIAIHEIAILLFRDFSHTSHTPEEREEALKQLPPGASRNRVMLKARPVDLYHSRYLNWEQYPTGVADMVGYWAEFQIFGGVILFDRGVLGDENNSAFIDDPLGSWIIQLSPAEIHEFFSTAQTSHSMPSESLPFQPDRYARRIDPADTVSLHIYRNLYDRPLKPEPRTWRTAMPYEQQIAVTDAYAKLRREGKTNE